MKVGEHEGLPKPEVCEFRKPVALVLTYNRTGLLMGTISSFLQTTKGIPVHVFDDGSTSETKAHELMSLESQDLVKVHRLQHQGFVKAWRAAFMFAAALKGYDSVITFEDDIVFADGWLDVLKKMQAGVAEKGLLQGMVTCFRPHSEMQSSKFDLKGVTAYQSFSHTFQVNLMPKAVIDGLDIFDEAAAEVAKSRTGKGLDVYWVALLAHRLHRVSFVCEQSWVAHVGFESVVDKQGYMSCGYAGVNLVPELKRFEESWKSHYELCQRV